MSGMQDSTSSSQAVSAVQPAQPEAVESLAAPVITYEQLASDLPKVELDRAVADARPPMTNPGGVDSQQATACDSSDKDGSSRATGSADVGNEAREETPRTELPTLEELEEEIRRNANPMLSEYATVDPSQFTVPVAPDASSAPRLSTHSAATLEESSTGSGKVVSGLVRRLSFSRRHAPSALRSEAGHGAVEAEGSKTDRGEKKMSFVKRSLSFGRKERKQSVKSAEPDDETDVRHAVDMDDSDFTKEQKVPRRVLSNACLPPALDPSCSSPPPSPSSPPSSSPFSLLEYLGTNPQRDPAP
mmetsp:Transcript_1482/g.3074  ORF Transcript_1482/g.3074 Transcript_1482/m.3074 type:complete len:302 (+) Transcript_1482:159-1064(+)